MALTFTAYQIRAALLSSFEGWSDSAASPAWDVLVNRAWEQFSWDAELVIASQNVTTVIGTLAYSLTGQMKRVLDVVYDTASAKSPVLHSTEDYERNLRADWRVQANGTPLRYTFNPFNTISLLPIPDAVKTVSVRGFVQGTDMSGGTDVLPIPGVLEEAVCIYAAYLWGKVYAQGEGRTRLKDYLDDYQKYVSMGKSYANLEAMGS